MLEEINRATREIEGEEKEMRDSEIEQAQDESGPVELPNMSSTTSSFAPAEHAAGGRRAGRRASTAATGRDPAGAHGAGARDPAAAARGAPSRTSADAVRSTPVARSVSASW